MSDTVGLGVMGCADIARRRMLQAFTAEPGARVAAVASRDLERARRVAKPYGCRAVRGYAELLAEPEVEAVYVPLPLALHAEWVEAALLAGKHVLAEKPLTSDPARTSGLLALARARGLVLRENVLFVHHSQHRRVRQLLSDGVLGDLRSFHASFTVPRLPAGDIRYRASLGGGALYDTGLYPVRAALHLLGPRLSVAGAVLTAGPGDGVDTSGAALLATPEGVTAQLSFGLDHAYRSRYTVQGSAGRVTLDRAFTPAADHRPVLTLERNGSAEEIRLAPDDQVARAVASFVRAVRRGDDDSGPAIVRQAGLLDEIRVRAGGPRKAVR
ncbi:Gfo/Idh/MocA family protein [Streptomyces sp. NPDC102283]|uniref:Gfo/Idh/MocA family protein n=1 Tax=Streptomyces sp. NPDC102283 TaxID=3366155 RepID=UPI00381DEB6B